MQDKEETAFQWNHVVITQNLTDLVEFQIKWCQKLAIESFTSS